MPALDTGAATLHNTHMMDLGNRIGTFCNYLILVDGGVLTITIGAFLNSTPPSIATGGLLAIRTGWYSLTAGLILALSVAFLVLLGQLAVQKKMNDAFTTNPTSLQLHRGPRPLGVAIRIAIWLAFGVSVLGLASVSYGAVQMLRLPG